MQLINQVLETQQNQNLWRKRKIIAKNTVSFITNDYLGLADHPRVLEAYYASREDRKIGSCASSVLGGYHEATQLLENELATFLNVPRVILFSSGYLANLAVITTLCRHLNIEMIYSDRLNHASIIDGIRLTHKKFQRFKHKDYEKLNALLEQKNKIYGVGLNRLCITESLFSVDGDIANIIELNRLSKNNNLFLMIDDAHGFGVLGETGSGVLDYFNLKFEEHIIIMGTFGKALGTFGAFVAGSESLIELLIQFARPYIYTTALPLPIVESTIMSLQILQLESWRREHLKKLIVYFKELVKETNLNFMESQTQIQLLPCTDPKMALSLQALLEEKGIIVGALRPPTVPKGGSRLRINLSAKHSRSDIETFMESLVWAIKQL